MFFTVRPKELGHDERKAVALFERVAKECNALQCIPILVTENLTDPAIVAFGEMWQEHVARERALEAAKELVHPYVVGDVFWPNTSCHRLTRDATCDGTDLRGIRPATVWTVGEEERQWPQRGPGRNVRASMQR